MEGFALELSFAEFEDLTVTVRTSSQNKHSK